MFKKIVSLVLSVLLLLCAVQMTGVFAADAAGLTVTDYGMLIGLASVIGDNDLTVDLAQTNSYVKKLSVRQTEIYYDLWDTGLDMSVCITGVDKVTGGADMQITARAYVTVLVGGQETVLYADAFTSTYNKNV